MITGCTNKITLPADYDIQLTPKKPTTESLIETKITYIIPNNIDSSKGVEGLSFNNQEWGRETKREKILVFYNHGHLKIERRTDNGVAGSGKIYKIDVQKYNTNGNKEITFTLKTIDSYQDGIILPFPIPDFDLTTYLKSASILQEFEFISEYPVDSIKSNFDRLLTRSGSKYELNNGDFNALLEINIHPYRSGTKILVKATLFNKNLGSNIIETTKFSKILKEKIKNVVKN